MRGIGFLHDHRRFIHISASSTIVPDSLHCTTKIMQEWNAGENRERWEISREPLRVRGAEKGAATTKEDPVAL